MDFVKTVGNVYCENRIMVSVISNVLSGVIFAIVAIALINTPSDSHFVKTTGIIVNGNVKQISDVYTIEKMVEYEIDGKKYVNKLLSLRSFELRESAESLAMARIGQLMYIYYDPLDPSKIVEFRGEESSLGWVFGGVALLFSVIALLLFLFRGNAFLCGVFGVSDVSRVMNGTFSSKSFIPII